MLLVHADLLCRPSPAVPADVNIVGLLTACYAAMPIARSASTRHATRGPPRQHSWARASATSAAAAAPSAPTTTTARTALTMRPVGQPTPARSRHAQSLTKALRLFSKKQFLRFLTGSNICADPATNGSSHARPRPPPCSGQLLAPYGQDCARVHACVLCGTVIPGSSSRPRL